MTNRGKGFETARGMAAGMAVAAALLTGDAVGQTTGEPSGGEPIELPRQGTFGGVPGDVTFRDGVSSTERSFGTLRSRPARSRLRRANTVLDRRRPDYDPEGIRAGNFIVFPIVSLSANGTNNVYRQPNGVSDLFLRSDAKVSAESDWSAHQLAFSGGIQQRIFSKYSTEDTTTYNGSLSGALDVSRAVGLTAGLSYKHDYINRTSVNEIIITRSPVEYDEFQFDTGGAVQLGRFGVGLNLTYTKQDYEDSRSFTTGARLDQQFRDYQSYMAVLTVGYALPGGQQLFASGSYEDRNFRVAAVPRRDGQVVELLAGIRSDITPLLRGRAAFGYIEARFDEEGVPGRSGLAADVELNYLFSELTTFSLTVRRQLTNVSVPNAPGAFNTRIDLVADHELLRNVILSPGLSYNVADFIDSPLRSRFYGANFTGTWLIDRRFRVEGQVAGGRSRSNSTIAPPRAANISGRVGVSFQL